MTVLTRQQLYNMVWETPTRTAAGTLGISDVGLAKMCRKFHIPRPWRGYWREKETGRRPRQPKLPPWPTHLGPEPQAISFRARAPAPEQTQDAPREPENVQQQRSYEAKPEHLISVSEQLRDSDPLVRKAARQLRRATR